MITRAFFLVFWFFSLSFLGWGQPPRRLVLISIDGLRPDHYLDPNWPMPELQSLRNRGAWASRSLPVFPSITYANHASMVTGVSPAVHGIDSNIDFSWRTGPLPNWNWEASRLKVPALWDRCHQAGLSCAAFSWPVSVGAQIDVNIPEIFHVAGANQGTTEQLIRQASTPGLLDQLPARPFPQTFAEWDRWLPATVAHVWRTHAPRLTLVHMLNLDWTQHRFGPHSAETRAAARELDRDLGQLVSELDFEQDLLIVAGDHGFVEIRKTLAPNRLFWEKGWIVQESGRIVSWKVLARTNGGSAAVYCKDARLLPRVEALLQRHAAGRWRLISAQQLREWRTFEGAALALSALPGNALSASVKSPLEVHSDRPLGQHGHLPEWVPAGLLVVGPGVAANSPLGECSVLDIAPSICRWLGLPSAGMERPGLKLRDD